MWSSAGIGGSRKSGTADTSCSRPYARDETFEADDEEEKGGHSATAKHINCGRLMVNTWTSFQPKYSDFRGGELAVRGFSFIELRVCRSWNYCHSRLLRRS